MGASRSIAAIHFPAATAGSYGLNIPKFKGYFWLLGLLLLQRSRECPWLVFRVFAILMKMLTCAHVGFRRFLSRRNGAAAFQFGRRKDANILKFSRV